ncbi:MAG: prepilin-type N-terminal cleavage/methylation domain-containing protein [Gemmataceae bacterium]|nr:prepilin-type N-terminal cleavage/methylation domain-containing protein [Gemmataceae bacterium]
MRHQPRHGFTLIELLVGMALTMFIMLILAEAFSTGMGVFSQLKAIGDMEENLRSATTNLRSDLAADHFTGKRRLSDLNFYREPPDAGFLRIHKVATLAEGNDSDGIPSFRSTTHVLHLTVKRRGNRREDFFPAVVPASSPLLTAQTNFFDQPNDARVQDTANTFHSQWAEVAYFPVKTGTTVEPNNPSSVAGTPLYALYRTQLAVVPDTSRINPPGTLARPAAEFGAYSKVSCRVPPAPNNTNIVFNNPSDLTDPANRAFNPTAPDGRGATLLLSNVVSFHVRVLRFFPTGVTGTLDTDFQDTAFESKNDDTNPAATGRDRPFFIRAVAVTLRVFDQKTQQTRQITIVQDM